MIFLLLLLFPEIAWAGVPKSTPVMKNAYLQQFIESFRDHHNVLERITHDPNGVEAAMPGYHLEATFDAISHICLATGAGPERTNEWKCTPAA